MKFWSFIRDMWLFHWFFDHFKSHKKSTTQPWQSPACQDNYYFDEYNDDLSSFSRSSNYSYHDYDYDDVYDDDRFESYVHDDVDYDDDFDY